MYILRAHMPQAIELCLQRGSISSAQVKNFNLRAHMPQAIELCHQRGLISSAQVKMLAKEHACDAVEVCACTRTCAYVKTCM